MTQPELMGSDDDPPTPFPQIVEGSGDLPVLYTSAFWNSRVKAAALAGEIVPVAITLFPVRRPQGYRIPYRLPNLAPNHALFRVDDLERFRPGFLDLLKLRWSKARAELVAVGKYHPGLPAVMLCWDRVDRPQDWCHRTVVAEFITGMEGVEILEF